MIPTIAHALQLVHTIRACETTRAGFGDPESHRRTTAALARFFYVRTPLQAFYGRAVVGASSDAPGSFVSGSPTPPCARPPRLATGCGLTAHNGGHAMAALPIPARSAHTFPQTEKAARRAVRRWFAGTPYLILAEWRDQARLVHCARLPANPAREAAFDQAFAQELAAVIAGGASHA